MLKAFVRFTCSTGLVMQSITCATSGSLTASCTTVTWSALRVRDQRRPSDLRRCSSSHLRLRVHVRWIRASCISSSRTIRSGQLRRNSSITVCQHHRTCRNVFSIMRACHSVIMVHLWDHCRHHQEHSGQAHRTDTQIIRSSHPHMESLLFDSTGELKTSMTEIEIEKSFTVIDMRVNPWELQDSNSMEVDDGNHQAGQEVGLRIRQRDPHLQCRKDHPQVTWIVISDQTSLFGSQSSTSNSVSAFSESACQSVSTHLHRQLRSSPTQLIIIMWGSSAHGRCCRVHNLHQGSMSNYHVYASLAQDKRGWLSLTQSHHVVSLVVSVMCLMLKCMETSKVQIQIKNQIWSCCLGVLVMLILFGHFVTHFDKKNIGIFKVVIQKRKKWQNGFLAKITICREGRKMRIFVYTIWFGQNVFWPKKV